MTISDLMHLFMLCFCQIPHS